MTLRVRLKASDNITCQLCNPAALADYESRGVILHFDHNDAPLSSGAFCDGCISKLCFTNKSGTATEIVIEPEIESLFLGLIGATPKTKRMKRPKSH